MIDPTKTNDPEVGIVDLGVARPPQARIFIAQYRSEPHEWTRRDGLVFLKNSRSAKEFLERTLLKAREEACDIVLLPELSVPEECIKIAQDWSHSTGSIVVAGSHYFRTREGYIARSPVIIAGSVYFVEKIHPAPIEQSPLVGSGLQPGKTLLVFRNTSIGTFSVLICADYLEHTIVRSLPLDELDLLCVIAYQRTSSDYHIRMNIEAEDRLNGLYLAYANALCPGSGDGRSAFFAVMDDIFSSKIREAGLTDLSPPSKILEFKPQHDSAVLDLDLSHKRPTLKRTVQIRPNVYIHSIESRADSTTERFGAAIGRADDRYVRITDFYVPPAEYDAIISILERNHIAFITGDPGLGKSYTAVRLLRHYFDLGYDPIWFAGLERTERLNQRQILDNFQPRKGQILYFEDPFGRTIFEKRESVRRTIGPLVDALKSIDARVVVTSRQEIFEQFSHESVSLTDLSVFTRELNVVKPSYPRQALVEILERHARGADWYGNEECRAIVRKEIENGKLATPLAIRDFAFSTARISDVNMLLENLERRNREEKLSFVEDIAAGDLSTKILLSLVFTAGHQTLATLTAWFNQLASELLPDTAWNGTAPFFEVLRRQTGYRIESYGVRAHVLRFAHPYYEEAFATAVRDDGLTATALKSVVKLLASVSTWSAINAVMRQADKYPHLGLELCRDLIVAVRTTGRLFEFCHLASECLERSYSELGSGYLDLLQEFLPIRSLFEALNRESDMRTLSHALRLGFNYRRELSHRGRLEPEYAHSVSSLIDWERLYELWKFETSWATSIDAFEWASRIDASSVWKFFRILKESEIYLKIQSLTRRQQERLLQVMPGSRLRTRLVAAIGAQIGPKLPRQWAEFYRDEDSVNAAGLIIDHRALTALRQGKNLLPVGVTEVVGTFERFDVVALFEEGGRERAAIAITDYGSEEVRKIMGRHSRLIDYTLGYSYGRAIMRSKKIAFFSTQHRTVAGDDRKPE